MYMHIYVNFYDLYLNVYMENFLPSIENVYQRQNAPNLCEQLCTILNQHAKNTYSSPTNMQAPGDKTKGRDNKIFLN